MAHNKKRMLAAILTALAIFSFCTAGSYAFWRSVGVSGNVLTTGELQGTIVEVYEEPEQGIYPGDTVEKIVNVRNDGSLDMVVRLKVEKYWEDTSANLDADMILIDFSSEMWLDGGDGYYYYRGILSPGETTQEALMESFTLDASASNEYSGQKAQIVVSMECLQATANALEAEWGLSYDDLGIEEPEEEETETILIEFTSDREFVFGNDGDIFAAFNTLAPGETRTQSIELKNSSDEAVEIFLSAEELGSDVTETLQEFLRDYATISVIDEDGTVLYSGPADNSELLEEISLGTYEAGESKLLAIVLEVSASAGNEFQGLSADEIQWTFTAQGDDGDTTSGSTGGGTSSGSTGSGTNSLPKTGDDNLIIVWCVCMGAIAAIMALLVFLYDRREKKNIEQGKGK